MYTLGALGNFLVLVVLVIFVFALTGMQLFGGVFRSERPRTHFDTLPASLRTVFQLLTGSRWRQVMVDMIGATNPSSALYFVTLNIVGSFVARGATPYPTFSHCAALLTRTPPSRLTRHCHTPITVLSTYLNLRIRISASLQTSRWISAAPEPLCGDSARLL